MKPVYDLPPDSDLKVNEAFYTAEQLADVGFVYREMLVLRGALGRLVDTNAIAIDEALMAIRGPH